MHFEGTVQIDADRDKVWAFLVDPNQVENVISHKRECADLRLG